MFCCRFTTSKLQCCVYDVSFACMLSTILTGKVLFIMLGNMEIVNGSVLLFKSSQVEESESDAYVEKLRSNGFIAHSIEVLGFDFVDVSDKAIVRHLSKEGLDNISGIIFTSRRAVKAVYKFAAQSTDMLCQFHSAFSRRHVFAVGESTAKEIGDLLGLQAIGHESGNAEALAEFIKTVVPSNSKSLLFPVGNLGGDRLLKNLTDAGIAVESFTVYRTKPHDHLQANIETYFSSHGFPEILVYFSPSGLKFTLPILRNLNFPLADVKFVAIGPSTRDALAKDEITPISTAKRPNPESLVAAILDFRSPPI